MASRARRSSKGRAAATLLFLSHLWLGPSTAGANDDLAASTPVIVTSYDAGERHCRERSVPAEIAGEIEKAFEAHDPGGGDEKALPRRDGRPYLFRNDSGEFALVSSAAE